jgi:glyoxylase-like metal-dependent hydrolase (beta-lactamase superfamily II)
VTENGDVESGEAPHPVAEARPRRTDGRLTREVADRVHRLEHAHVNCYLIEHDDGVTVVDAAFPDTWSLLLKALSAIGREPAEVAALVLTHGHFDHLGFARRAARQWGIPVYGHLGDEHIAAHPYRYAHERSRLATLLQHPNALPVLGAMVAVGALRVPGVEVLSPMLDGDVLDVPGRPHVVFSPGHTLGHCALHLPDRSVLFTGDALVTLDPYTGEEHPTIVSGAATANSVLARSSLAALEATDAATVLPGHGAPWRQGIREAVAVARRPR